MWYPLRRSILVLIIMILTLPYSNIVSGNISQAQIKAVFLYNFSSFVRWPKTAYATPNSAFNYCTIGMDDVVKILPSVIAEESVNQHPLKHTPLKATDDMQFCHIVYIALQNKQMSRKIINKTHGNPILLVSSMTDFHSLGGAITLSFKRKRVHPIINITAIHSLNITVNAKLMRLATVIK